MYCSTNFQRLARTTDPARNVRSRRYAPHVTTNRTASTRILTAGAVIAATTTILTAGPASAGWDDYNYQQAEATFTTTNSSITATIHNPNEQGVCNTSIRIGGNGGPDDHTGHLAPFGGLTESEWPTAGQTVTATHDGLEPGEYRITTFCRLTITNWGNYSTREDTIRVGPEPAPAGSLGLGSLGG